MSFVDDELFFMETKQGGAGGSGVVLKNKTISYSSSWSTPSSMFNGWTSSNSTPVSSVLNGWTNTSWTASSLLGDWSNTSVSSLLKTSSDWSNISVASVLDDWGINTEAWDDWDDWFPSRNASSSSTSDSTNSYFGGRFFGGGEKTSSNKTASLYRFTPKVSIVIDFRNKQDDQSDAWLSRMAFAKMLQLEASSKYGVTAELVVVGSDAPLSSWSHCFPRIDTETKLVSDVKELNLKELEQEQWLGEMAVLLEASPDVWEDGLYLLKEHSHSKVARYTDDISLPFLRVSDLAPALSEWKHVEAVKDFLRINPECCTLPPIKVSEAIERETIVNLQSPDVPSIQPTQLLRLLDRPKWTRVVLVGNEPDGTVDDYATLLQDERGYVVQSVHKASLGGASMEARYCLLQQSHHEMIGSLDSPSSVWAAMSLNRDSATLPIIRLVGAEEEEVIRLQQTMYPSKDPRSRIRVESLPPPVPVNKSLTAYSLGSKERPISLVVQLASTSIDNIVYGYALQYLLRTSYNIETTILLRRQEYKWIKMNGPVKKCFAQLANIDPIAAHTEQFDARRQQQQNSGLAQTFEISTPSSADEKLAAIHQLLQNTTSWTSLPLPKNVTVSTTEPLITFPFVYLGESAQIRVDDGFQETFKTIFTRAENSCTQFGTVDELWAKVAAVGGSKLSNTEAQVPKKESEKQPETSSKKQPDIIGTSMAGDKTEPKSTGTFVPGPGALGSANRPISLVIHLSGEMANNLGKIAFGYALKWMLEEDYNITAKTLLRHQQRGKWVNGMKSVKTCFPNLAQTSFKDGNTPEYDVRIRQQGNLWQNRPGSFENEETNIRETIGAYIEAMGNGTLFSGLLTENATITLPFIESSAFANVGYMNDRYFNRYKELFQFDEGTPECCSERPLPDESIFHFRGFTAEMPKKGVKFGFEELSPNKTANELFANHKPEDKIAVIGRFHAENVPYLKAMKAAGFDARIVDANGEQSFCFLMSGQGELVGNAQSTFMMWAAYLGNASKARLYSLKSPSRLMRSGSGYALSYNFTNPVLKKKMSLESINSEQQDINEHKGRRLLQQTNA
jgi:hypothetical protein